MTAWQTCQKPLAGNRVNQAGFRHPQTRTQANTRARERGGKLQRRESGLLNLTQGNQVKPARPNPNTQLER